MAHVTKAITQTANTEAQVRYQPEIDALQVLLQNAQSQHDTAVHNAHVGANIILAAASKAQAPLLAGYRQILGDQTKAHQQFSQDLATVAGASSSPLAAGNGAAEAKIAADNLGLSAQAVLGMLSETGTRAAQGAVYQTGQADRQLAGTVGQVGTQVASIKGQAGDYAAQQIASMLSDQSKQDFTAAQNAADRRNSAAISAADNATSTANAAAGNAQSNTNNQRSTSAANWRTRVAQQGQNKPKPVTPAERRAESQYVDQIDKVNQALPSLQGFLVHINPKTGQVVAADKTGAFPDGTTTRHLTGAEINAAIVKKYGIQAPAVIQAGRELHNQGFVTKATATTLKNRYGIVLPSNYTTPKRKAAQTTGPKGAAPIKTSSDPLSPVYSPSVR